MGPKKTSNGLMKHHQNESSPQRPHPCSHRFYWILQKAAVCRIDELRQVECLISPVIIMMLLIDTGLSPTAASPGETFDPCSLSPGGASVYLPSPSLGRKTNTQDRFWARVCWGVFFPPHCPFATCMNCKFGATDRHIPRHTAFVFFFMPSRGTVFTFQCHFDIKMHLQRFEDGHR